LIGTVAVVFLRYSNIGSLLSSPKNRSSKDTTEKRQTVSSSVIAVAISSNPPTLYELEKITFTLKYAKVRGFFYYQLQIEENNS